MPETPRTSHPATPNLGRPEGGDRVGPGDRVRRLVQAAIGVLTNAYAPYSRYHVAAAVLADNGNIYTGCNVENAVYPLTICAERAAIATAVSDGARRLIALAVVTENGGTPCGSCRQVMREFGDDDMPVYIADTTGSHRLALLAELLPDSFSASDLTGGDQHASVDAIPDEHGA